MLSAVCTHSAAGRHSVVFPSSFQRQTNPGQSALLPPRTSLQMKNIAVLIGINNNASILKLRSSERTSACTLNWFVRRWRIHPVNHYTSELRLHHSMSQELKRAGNIETVCDKLDALPRSINPTANTCKRRILYEFCLGLVF